MSATASLDRPAPEEILRVRDLHVEIPVYSGVIQPLNGFDLTVNRGEMAALVGESGSGKSVAAWSILSLPKPPAKIVTGEIHWHGESVLAMLPDRVRHYRGKEVSLILANPRSHIHPLRRVGDQVEAVLRAHQRVSADEARDATLSMLSAVGLPDAARIAKAYPHELSGGMAQRIVIAMALINSPQLVIADDATNGLDVTVQRQVLDLMTDLVNQRHASMLMITHDLGVVAQYCRRATVMYAGQAVEIAETTRLFDNPLHPYTHGLLGTIRAVGATRGKPLPGLSPNPAALPAGCYLEPRCPVRLPECKQIRPEMRQAEPGHWVRCVHFADMGDTGTPGKPTLQLHPVPDAPRTLRPDLVTSPAHSHDARG
ncbi:MAG: ABC transporter ATP-binding protein [Thermomicrobiales bacterium]